MIRYGCTAHIRKLAGTVAPRPRSNESGDQAAPYAKAGTPIACGYKSSHKPDWWCRSDEVMKMLRKIFNAASVILLGLTVYGADAVADVRTAAPTLYPATVPSVHGNHQRTGKRATSRIRVVYVSTGAQLQSAIDDASAGTVIRLADGAYHGPFKVKKNGKALKGITFVAVNHGRAVPIGDQSVAFKRSFEISMRGIRFID